MVWVFFLSLQFLYVDSLYKGDLSCKSPSEANKREDERFSNLVSVVQQNAVKKEKQNQVECPALETNIIYVLQGQKVDKKKKKKREMILALTLSLNQISSCFQNNGLYLEMRARQLQVHQPEE